MPVITEDAIRELAGFRGGNAPVTTCYLDVDGRRYVRHQDFEQELQGLLRKGRVHANGTASVHHDLERIENFVRQGIDRSRTRGLAMFACSPHGLFEVVSLPVPVRNQVVVNEIPAVGQLEAVVQERRRTGVLLVDRQRARLFVFDLGELVDRSELLDELPRDYDHRGERERGGVDHHVEELANQHIRKAARALFDLHHDHDLHQVVVGCPEELVGTVEASLHPYLQERLIGRLSVPVGARLSEVEAAVVDVELAQERAREAALVDQLRAAAGAGRLGVTGLEPTLDVLAQGRIDTLLVSHGFATTGWRCDPCARLYLVGPTCRQCGSPLSEIEDVVEEAVDQALAGSARVEICPENADLDVLGRVGALLRF